MRLKRDSIPDNGIPSPTKGIEIPREGLRFLGILVFKIIPKIKFRNVSNQISRLYNVQIIICTYTYLQLLLGQRNCKLKLQLR